MKRPDNTSGTKQTENVPLIYANICHSKQFSTCEVLIVFVWRLKYTTNGSNIIIIINCSL